jgi:beta-N-acetylhexosaminidase
MVSHAAFPGLGAPDRAADLSPEVVRVLRRDLGFDGLVLTDDLEMGAVEDVDAAGRAVAALDAGCDLLLFCSRRDEADAAHAGLAAAAERDQQRARRLYESAARVRALRAELARHRS